MVTRSNRRVRRLQTLSAVLLACAVAGAASAGSASAAISIGPLVLSGKQTITVPSLKSFSPSVSQHGSGGGAGKIPSSAQLLTVVTTPDKTSPQLLQAALAGTAFKTVSLTWTNGTITDGMCMTDVLIASFHSGAGGSGDQAGGDTFGLSYSKVKLVYGSGPTPCSGGAGTVPAVQSTLLGLTRRSSAMLARVDCLTAHCRGTLSVSLPSAACLGGSKSSCSLGGAKFAMGDGSVKVLRLPVPGSLRSWLNGNSHATLKTIIVVRGLKSPLIQRDTLNPTGGKGPAIPSEAVPVPPVVPPVPGPPGPSGGGPSDLSQAVAIGACNVPLPANPKAVFVSGTVTPARFGVDVTLTYTPTSGPMPYPAAVSHTVHTDAAGNFTDAFDRADHGWSVVASVAEGGGYAAAQSASCAVPIP